MGASSYSGKGSASQSRPSYREKNSASEMAKTLDLLQEVERCREIVDARKMELRTAEADLERAEQNVSAQINKLDPKTKARFRRMMGGLDTRKNGQDENVR